MGRREISMEVVYWNEKVERFINDLDTETTFRVEKTIYALETYGHLIGMPDSKSLGGGLFELRTLGKKQVRIIYIFHLNKAYIIHGFIKKSWRIGLHDIRYARQIQKELLNLV